MTGLQSSWDRCWKALDASGDGLALLQDLIAAYREPHRKYHTTRHLSECLALFEKNIDLAMLPGEVELALWFHDAVYNVRASDNEAKSAEWAAEALTKAGVKPDHIHNIRGHIMATRHSTLPQGEDQMLLVDIDLSILGAPRPRFVEYEAQVRAEYGWVPEFLFRSKRRDILTELIARNPIFNTPRLREQLENQAQENLAYSIAQLSR